MQRPLFDLDNSSWSYITRNFLSDIEKKGQIKNIRSFYGKLIEKMAELCRKGKSIREIDRQYFEIKITMKTKNNEKID